MCVCVGGGGGGARYNEYSCYFYLLVFFVFKGVGNLTY